MHDAHKLKAQCLWRMGRAVDATNSFLAAKKFLEKKGAKYRMSRRDFETLLNAMDAEEFKEDVQEGLEVMTQMRSSSVSNSQSKEPILVTMEGVETRSNPDASVMA